VHGEVNDERTEKLVQVAEIRTTAYKQQMYNGTDFHSTETVRKNTKKQVEKKNRRIFGRFQDQPVGGWSEI
jgi:hypothetical protein